MGKTLESNEFNGSEHTVLQRSGTDSGESRQEGSEAGTRQFSIEKIAIIPHSVQAMDDFHGHFSSVKISKMSNLFLFYLFYHFCRFS